MPLFTTAYAQQFVRQQPTWCCPFKEEFIRCVIIVIVGIGILKEKVRDKQFHNSTFHSTFLQSNAPPYLQLPSLFDEGVLIAGLAQRICRKSLGLQGQWEPSQCPKPCLMVQEVSGFTKLLVIAVSFKASPSVGLKRNRVFVQ